MSLERSPLPTNTRCSCLACTRCKRLLHFLVKLVISCEVGIKQQSQTAIECEDMFVESRKVNVQRPSFVSGHWKNVQLHVMTVTIGDGISNLGLVMAWIPRQWIRPWLLQEHFKQLDQIGRQFASEMFVTEGTLRARVSMWPIQTHWFAVRVAVISANDLLVSGVRWIVICGKFQVSDRLVIRKSLIEYCFWKQSLELSPHTVRSCAIFPKPTLQPITGTGQNDSCTGQLAFVVLRTREDDTESCLLRYMLRIYLLVHGVQAINDLKGVIISWECLTWPRKTWSTWATGLC